MHTITAKRVSTIRKIGWLSVASMLALALLAPAANATHGVTVVTSLQDSRIDGNPSCTASGNAEQGLEDWFGGGQDWIEFKIDASEFDDGKVYDVGGGKTITLQFAGDDESANTIDWSSNFGIDAILVKTGQGSGGYNTVYVYAPDAGHAEAMSGTVANGGPTGISHLSFCYDVSDPTTSTSTSTTTTSTTTTSTTTSSTTTSSTTTGSTTTSTTTGSTTTGSTTTGSTTTGSTTTGSTTTPSQIVLAETGTPSVTLPPTDSITGTSAPSGGSWRMLLIAMAVLLASVMVMTPAKAANRRR